jgi:hypothetical protein
MSNNTIVQQNSFIQTVEAFSQKVIGGTILVGMFTITGCLIGGAMCYCSEYYEHAGNAAARSYGEYTESAAKTKLLNCGCITGGIASFTGSIALFYNSGLLDSHQKKSDVLIETTDLENQMQSSDLDHNITMHSA